MKKNDPALYRKLSEPFESLDAAQSALVENHYGDPNRQAGMLGYAYGVATANASARLAAARAAGEKAGRP